MMNKEHFGAAIMVTLALLMASSYRATARYCELVGGAQCDNDEMCYNLCALERNCGFTSGRCTNSTCECIRDRTVMRGKPNCELTGGAQCDTDETCYNLCALERNCGFTGGRCTDSRCHCIRDRTVVRGEANDGEGEAAGGHGGGGMLISN